MGEHQLQEVVQVVVSVRLPCGVPKEGVAVTVGDLPADVKLEVAEGSCGVEFCGLISEPDRERAVCLPPLIRFGARREDHGTVSPRPHAEELGARRPRNHHVVDAPEEASVREEHDLA